MSYPLYTGTYSINGRQYRKTPYQSSNNSAAETFEDTPDIYEDEPTNGCSVNVESEMKRTKKHLEERRSESPQPTEDSRIEVVNGKKWIAKIAVPQAFMGKFVGHNRRSLKALEDDTGCRVKTPRRDEKKPCEISSLSGLESVQRCLDRIEMFIEDARKSSRVTHFIAIPCDQQEIIDNYAIFTSCILETDVYHASTKNSKLFTSPNRLHLTLSVVRLFDEQEIEKALQILADLKPEINKILSNSTLMVDIQGVDIMNDDPANVNVLFAKAQGEGLQGIANLVRNRFVEAGLSREEIEDDVKLHMTLMNGRYVAQAENKRNHQFDATKILEDMSEFCFGTIPIHEICLCPLNSTTSSDKFYQKLGNVQI